MTRLLDEPTHRSSDASTVVPLQVAAIAFMVAGILGMVVDAPAGASGPDKINVCD